MINKILIFYFALCLLFFTSCKTGTRNSKLNDTLEGTLNQKMINNTDTISENEILVLDCKDCDIKVVTETKQNIDSLTEEQTYKFLCCLSESTSNNIEFSEYSNEVLFLLLSKNAELVLSTLERHKNIAIEPIKTTLENPISDRIDLQEIYGQLQKIKGYDKIKGNLLQSIKKAIDKYN